MSGKTWTYLCCTLKMIYEEFAAQDCDRESVNDKSCHTINFSLRGLTAADPDSILIKKLHIVRQSSEPEDCRMLGEHTLKSG